MECDTIKNLNSPNNFSSIGIGNAVYFYVCKKGDCVFTITGGVVTYGGVFSPYMIIGHQVIENDDFSFNITYHGGFFEVR